MHHAKAIKMCCLIISSTENMIRGSIKVYQNAGYSVKLIKHLFKKEIKLYKSLGLIILSFGYNTVEFADSTWDCYDPSVSEVGLNAEPRGEQEPSHPLISIFPLASHLKLSSRMMCANPVLGRETILIVG